MVGDVTIGEVSGDKDVYKTYEEEDALAEQEFVSKERAPTAWVAPGCL